MKPRWSLWTEEDSLLKTSNMGQIKNLIKKKENKIMVLYRGGIIHSGKLRLLSLISSLILVLKSLVFVEGMPFISSLKSFHKRVESIKKEFLNLELLENGTCNRVWVDNRREWGFDLGVCWADIFLECTTARRLTLRLAYSDNNSASWCNWSVELVNNT